MKKYLIGFIVLLIFSCSTKVRVINLDVKENQLYIQGKRVDFGDFEGEVEKLTKGFSRKKMKEITFSLKVDGKTTMGTISDLKSKIENWKKSNNSQ